MMIELTRVQVAQMMIPQVSARQLQKYLNIARKYIKGFEDFTDPKTNGINGYAKLNSNHVALLQEIRTQARSKRLSDIEKEYKQLNLET
jgi:hypothetical protein